jgi:hypothetical protein
MGVDGLGRSYGWNRIVLDHPFFCLHSPAISEVPDNGRRMKAEE